MTEPIIVCVGTDHEQHLAERALEASIRRNTTGPVEIHWMRQGDPGWDWGGTDAGWATPFTLFRYQIPEYRERRGRAIYMDVDMLAVGDLRELWEMDLKGLGAASTFRPDVILWDCAHPEWLDLHPREDAGARKQNYRRVLTKAVRLSEDWDTKDALSDSAKVIHFTVMRTQPWKPYRGRFQYDQPHPSPAAVELFWHYAQAGGVGDEIRKAIER